MMRPAPRAALLAAAGASALLAARVLRTAARTKDYFTAPVREAERLGVRERRIRVREGLELNVAEGPAGGVPLLLIPGQGVVWQEYARALPALLEACHVLVVDVHGHGASTWDPMDYTGERIAEDLATLIESELGGPAVLAGHSSGGILAALLAARRPDLVRGALLEDVPFFSTEPDRIRRTYVHVDAWHGVVDFLAQDRERDWVCWYMPGSYWARVFGPLWRVFTRSVIRQRRADPTRLPVIRWVGVDINRIWESMSHPFDLRFTAAFVDGSWLRGVDQAEVLREVSCPTTFVKAGPTRHDRDGTLLAALDEDDLARVESLLPQNRTVHVKSSHDVHFAHTEAYTDALLELVDRVTAGEGARTDDGAARIDDGAAGIAAGGVAGSRSTGPAEGDSR
jgi:pimeloyl-ACP methyl ester carboxylesterase